MELNDNKIQDETLKNCNDSTSLISLINMYNKYRLLYNIFQKVILKLNMNNKELYDKYMKQLENIKMSQLEFEHILFIDKNDINKEFKVEKLDEKNSMILLEMLESEIRNFFECHDFSNVIANEDLNSYNEEEIKKKFTQFIDILIENFDILSKIYTSFKEQQTKDKQKYLDIITTKFNSLKNILENMKIYIFLTLNSQQFYGCLGKIEENLVLEEKEKINKIKIKNKKLNEYVDKGKEMAELVAEYKRLSNMIDCIKIKNEMK